MKKGDKVKVNVNKNEMSDFMVDLEMDLADRTISSSRYDILADAFFDPNTIWEIVDEEPEGFVLGVRKGKSLIQTPFLIEESSLQK